MIAKLNENLCHFVKTNRRSEETNTDSCSVRKKASIWLLTLEVVHTNYRDLCCLPTGGKRHHNENEYVITEKRVDKSFN